MSSVSAASLEGGFTNPVFDSQATFRALMDALARPASPVSCHPRGAAPAPMTPLLASIALTLTDAETPVWLDPDLAARPEVRGWFAFHTGAPIVEDPAEAVFAFVTDPRRMPALSAFAQGTAEYPDRSTTVVVAATAFRKDGMIFTGPGIDGSVAFGLEPLITAFAEQWRENRARFPRGVDLVFATAAEIVGLPRSSRLRTE